MSRLEAGLRRTWRHLRRRIAGTRADVLSAPEYRLDLRRSRIDPRRIDNILAFLLQEGLVGAETVRRPQPASLRDLARVHTDEYLATLRRKDALTPIVGFPMSDELACRAARRCLGIRRRGRQPTRHGPDCSCCPFHTPALRESHRSHKVHRTSCPIAWTRGVVHAVCCPIKCKRRRPKLIISCLACSRLNTLAANIDSTRRRLVREMGKWSQLRHSRPRAVGSKSAPRST